MNKIDRYILRHFLSTLVFSIGALSIVFVVVSLFEKMDDFIDHNTPGDIIIKYYINYLPDIIKVLFPVGMLLSALFTTGRLSNSNEITAMKAAGMSLYRYITPLMVLAMMLSIGQLYFNGWVVPNANRVKSDIEREYLKKGDDVTSFSRLDFRDAPLRNVRMGYYNDVSRRGSSMNIEVFTSEESPRIVSSFSSPRFTWSDSLNNWLMYEVTERRFSGDKHELLFHDSLAAPVNITPHEIINMQRKSTELTFEELKHHIILASRGGEDVRREWIDYYGQHALPFANFIVVLFGIPFSGGKRKGGLALEIAAAMFIAFLYLVFTKVGQTVGYAANLDPVLSGWLANAVFLVAGIINIFRLRS